LPCVALDWRSIFYNLAWFKFQFKLLYELYYLNVWIVVESIMCVKILFNIVVSFRSKFQQIDENRKKKWIGLAEGYPSVQTCV
jgi:hypothetical protein